MAIRWKAQGVEIPLEDIAFIPAWNPRANSGIDSESIERFAEEISGLGFLIYPIILRERLPDDGYDIVGKYGIVDGSRRYRSIKFAGWKTATANILPADVTEQELYEISVQAGITAVGYSSYEIALIGRKMAEREEKSYETLYNDKRVGNGFNKNEFCILCRCVNPRNGLPKEIVAAWIKRDPLLQPRYLMQLYKMSHEDAVKHWRESSVSGKKQKIGRKKRFNRRDVATVKQKMIAERRKMPSKTFDYVMSLMEYASGESKEFPTYEP